MRGKLCSAVVQYLSLLTTHGNNIRTCMYVSQLYVCVPVGCTLCPTVRYGDELLVIPFTYHDILPLTALLQLQCFVCMFS